MFHNQDTRPDRRRLVVVDFLVDHERIIVGKCFVLLIGI